MNRPDIQLHRYYSNGAYGRAWGVRLVTGLGSDPDSGIATVTYKGVAGQCRRKTGSASLSEFAAWAKYEVALNENSWQRIGAATPE
ncbi:MAG: hypothetical protein PHS77_12695 [Gallionellaceae bacterium]|nr:hypothetical protein [Gallionellaceae bacterium]